MKTRITLLLVSSLFFNWSCSTTSAYEENIIANKEIERKGDVYLLIPSTKDTLYYKDLSKKDFYSHKENLDLIKDIFANPEKYGLSNEGENNDKSIYTNSNGFLIRKGGENNSLNTGKALFDDNDGPGATFHVYGEQTICDGLMTQESMDFLIDNSCPYNMDPMILLLAGKDSPNGYRPSNIAFMSANDRVFHDGKNHYIVLEAIVYTWSRAWTENFEAAMAVDPVDCIVRLQ
ncbi:hypothetical protein [Flavobacterium tyrosinilyticum]|uniref:hypothetical protein n=1 Tax=Flavobacterium tyrosinilyticum TaxID=1658740 RepID=UPI00202FD9F8|nr:hypothetical protein [Flavobacterium tyrosinilyticum]MCM0665700.1 hypothetical protein [Flavobacterium tyrosinilyticum]